MKLNTNVIAKFALLSFMLVGVIAFSTANAYSQENEKDEKPDAMLAKQAKVSMATARKAALKRAPGKVEGAELEKEKGKLIYSFDIRTGKKTITEVWVDAKTGKVIHASKENAADEAKEKAEDMKSKNKDDDDPQN